MADAMRTPSGAPSQTARDQHGDSEGKFPVFDHKSAHSALMLRHNGKGVSAASVIAKVRAWANDNGDKAILAECDAAVEADKSDSAPSMRAEEELVLRGPVEERAATVQNVDWGQRIVSILAVPFEQPTSVEFRGEQWTEVFSPGSFAGFDPSKRRVPVSAVFQAPAFTHEGAHLVGKVVGAATDRPEGLVLDTRISKTAAGDEALQLAHDDALAPSVGFVARSNDMRLDRRSMTRRIDRAFLDHLTYVPTPAYDGARVLAMRAQPSAADPSPTPAIDDYYNDPMFAWAVARLDKPE